MVIRTCKYALALIILITGAIAEAGQDTLKQSGSFTIRIKATAADQFAYASRITAGSNDVSTRNEAILKSVAALEVIPRRWPGERELSLRAYVEIVNRLNGARLHKNAIQICDKAIAYAEKSPQRLVLVAAKGRALMWLGRSGEAEEAFKQATSGEFHRLADFEKNLILADASFFHERHEKFDVAARETRERARLCRDEIARADVLRKAVDLSMRSKDHSAAKADLSALMETALHARMRTLTPEQQEVLRRIDASIEEYRKKLGV